MATDINVRSDHEQMKFSQRVWRAGALWLLGLLAVGLTTVLVVTTVDQNALAPDKVPFGPGMAIAISLGINGALLAFAVAIGALTAHRCGLVSLIAHRTGDYIRRLKGFPIYLVIGILLGLSVALIDAQLFKNIPALADLSEAVKEKSKDVSMPFAARLGARLAYGGIVEEILSRWCVMSLLAWLILKAGAGRMVAVSAAIVLSSFLFGLGHLPALFELVQTVPMEMIIRTVGLNMIAGVAYGIAYARNSLEAAMVMHAATHIGLLASATTGA